MILNISLVFEKVVLWRERKRPWMRSSTDLWYS